MCEKIATMNDALEKMYRTHHATGRSEDFALLGDERGVLLRKFLGTGQRILDVGCRDGALTGTYSTGNTVLGVDIDSEALSRAKEKLGIEVMKADLNGDWSALGDGYDAVVACEVVEHLYYPDQVLAKAARALRPGGLFVGSEPNAFSLAHRYRYVRLKKRHTPLGDPTHINHFTVKELEQLLSKKFVDVKVYGIGRYTHLARMWPQLFAFGLVWSARKPDALS